MRIRCYCAIAEFVLTCRMHCKRFGQVLTCRDKMSPVVCHDAKTHARGDRNCLIPNVVGQSKQFLADCLRRIEIGTRFGNDTQRI